MVNQIEVKVSEKMATTKIDALGSLICYRNFEANGHAVRIEVSGNSGYAQSEHCDCQTFKSSKSNPRTCDHIAAVKIMMANLANDEGE
jgi:hypothetical protein